MLKVLRKSCARLHHHSLFPWSELSCAPAFDQSAARSRLGLVKHVNAGNDDHWAIPEILLPKASAQSPNGSGLDDTESVAN